LQRSGDIHKTVVHFRTQIDLTFNTAFEHCSLLRMFFDQLFCHRGDRRTRINVIFLIVQDLFRDSRSVIPKQVKPLSARQMFLLTGI
jgi:hypothetical protein